MASISLHNVTKIFERRTTAVSGVTLDVRDGEFVVIAGPSGCGKTTILRLIAGLEAPTTGAIRIADRVVEGVPPKDRDVAMVFQDGVLYPHMSVYDNLAFPLRMRGLPRDRARQRVEEVVGVLGLADLLDRRPAALSGGQRQRVALGRALVRTPAAFLFDEPLSSLDAGLRLTLREEIKTLHQRLHLTALYVTHDQSEAMALGDRLCVLRDGHIQQVGPPAEVYDRPVNRFVAGFFGTPPMNFLAGRLRDENGACFLDWAGGRTSWPTLPADGGETAVQVGVRPHDLSLEPFGSRTDVHVGFASGEKCVVSAPPHVQLTIDAEVRVCVDPEKLHLFCSDGTTLKRPGGSVQAEGLGSQCARKSI